MSCMIAQCSVLVRVPVPAQGYSKGSCTDLEVLVRDLPREIHVEIVDEILGVWHELELVVW